MKPVDRVEQFDTDGLGCRWWSRTERRFTTLWPHSSSVALNGEFNLAAVV